MLPALLALTAPAAAPLDPLTADEMNLARRILIRANRATKATRFPGLWLDEPSKEAVAAKTTARTAFAVLYEPAKNTSFEARIDLRRKTIASWRELKNVQPLVLQQEYVTADEVVRADPQWRAAIRKRGLTKLDDIHLEPWAPGLVEGVEGHNRRLMKVLTFLRGQSTNPYARPIEGLIAVVDVNAKKVVRLEDTGVRPVPKESGDYTGKVAPLQPLLVSQPKGASFRIEGHSVRWDRWRFRYAYHPREGLVLHQVSFANRPILYRASLSEMSVPYGDPESTWNWRSAFDVGEYGIGILGSSLEPGSDVPRHATLLDAVLPSDDGTPRSLPRAVAVYERDGGVLWRHWDFVTGKTVSHRAQELVIGFMTAIGNYDYMVNYAFRQDGTISVDADLTGIMLAKGVPATKEPRHSSDATGHLVAPNVSAPNHQHFFSFRLDMDVDGADNNSVMESNTASAGADNAFTMRETALESEQTAMRDMDLAAARKWRVVNPGRRNRLGQMPGYALIPGENSVPYAQPDAEVRRRARFVDHHLWVTRYRPNELYSAGDFPSLNPRIEGLPNFIQDDESLVSQDVVLWYTLGVTHIPRPEDWPIMPTHRTGFKLIPVSFFDRNPTVGSAPRPASRR